MDTLSLEDPKVAMWMLQPSDGGDKNLHTIVMMHKPQLAGLLETLGTAAGSGSVSLRPTHRTSTTSGRARAIAEAVLVRHLMTHLKDLLREKGMLDAFKSKFNHLYFLKFVS